MRRGAALHGPAHSRGAAEITVERKAAEPRTLKDVREGLASVGLKLEDLRPFKFHTPEEVLELTAEDVTDDGQNKTS